jgi:phenylpropionate dioxygenase-like ring-hydroxylating dioxygenase large terminal subunit
MGELLRRYWLPVVLSAEVLDAGGPPIRVEILGEQLIAFRDGSGAIGLVDEFCVHRRASLFLGRVEEHGIRCAYHGWAYNTSGACIDMPSEPVGSTFKDRIRTTAYRCVEFGDVVWAYLGDPANTPALPELEWALVPASHRYITKRLQLTNFVQVLEGDVDGSHVAALHADFREWFPQVPGGGDGPSETVADPRPRYFVEPTPYGLMAGARRESAGDRYWWRINHLVLPCHTLVAPDPHFDPNVMCHSAVPANDHVTWVYTISYNPERPLTDEELDYYRNGGGVQPQLIPGTPTAIQNISNGYLVDRDRQRSGSPTGIRTVAMQDAALQESMGPIVARERERLGSSDVAVLAMRRVLLAAASAAESGVAELPGTLPTKHHVRPASHHLARTDDWTVASAEALRATHFGPSVHDAT